MITIFTPTYNRALCLSKLADSLLKQSFQDFEWIIVDDGSTDNTQKVIESLKKKMKIIYYYQKNSGKHIAYNRGIELASGEYFVCVDSDDTLDPFAIERYCSLIKKYNTEVGFVLRQNLVGANDISKWVAIDGKKVNIADLKNIYGIVESNPLIKTFYLKKYRFPHYKKNTNEYEKFCPEDYLYNQLSKEGRFIAKNVAVYNSAYRNDGLTSNIFNLWINNSEGVLQTLRLRYYMCCDYIFTYKTINYVKCILNINALCLATHKKLKDYSPNMKMSYLLIIPSILLKIRRYRYNSWFNLKD